ncbi:TRAP transporter small permease [Corticimicrobacter populi]|uniref:TRAP transporter small permease protein n=1 Tax=Corticimicrobacter populi TaxID=2175229 RepID=A0A2V1K0L0_9BURK|nr:TRAP transporter small permease [Corticimicrobacter populi]PWF21447.1 TRAP transporter small permease [Corticimicrobacter populi]
MLNTSSHQRAAARRLDTVLGGCMAICLAAMTVLVFANVVLRYAFNSGITWSEEMSRYFFVFMIFFGSVNAAMLGKHISVDMFVLRLAPGARRAARILACLLSLAVLAILAWGSWELAIINLQSRGPVTGFPLWLLFAGSLLMAVSIALITCRDLWRIWNASQNAHDDQENAA